MYIFLILLLAVQCCQAQQQLPTWRRHYLLSNKAVQLEPCSAQQLPRAWVASDTERQGTTQLPGTAELQKVIFDHQHPNDCSNATFLVFKHPGHLGLGAMVDYLADAIAWALAEGRVLLLDYQSPWTRYVMVLTTAIHTFGGRSRCSFFSGLAEHEIAELLWR
jgi:hypothetical protein